MTDEQRKALEAERPMEFYEALYHDAEAEVQALRAKLEQSVVREQKLVWALKQARVDLNDAYGGLPVSYDSISDIAEALRAHREGSKPEGVGE